MGGIWIELIYPYIILAYFFPFLKKTFYNKSINPISQLKYQFTVEV